jgi:hypothetical protein
MWFDPSVRWRRTGRCVAAETALFRIAERSDTLQEALITLQAMMSSGYAELVGQVSGPGGSTPTILCLGFAVAPVPRPESLPSDSRLRRQARARALAWCLEHGATEELVTVWDWTRLPNVLLDCLKPFYAAVADAERRDPSVQRLVAKWQAAPPFADTELDAARSRARRRARRRLSPLFRNQRLMEM